MKPKTFLLFSIGFTSFVILGIAYLAISVAAYRFRNPKLTETELFQRIPDALQWK